MLEKTLASWGPVKGSGRHRAISQLGPSVCTVVLTRDARVRERNTAVNKLLCEVPEVDVRRVALSGNFSRDKLEAGREADISTSVPFDPCDSIDTLPLGLQVYDLFWTEAWR